jgi:hypothetical protein
MSNEEFMTKVLEIMVDNEAKEDFHFARTWWDEKNPGKIGFFANCSDTFSWGCADSEEITPENVDLLEQSYKDIIDLIQPEEAKRYYRYHGATLFCSRVRKMRPMKKWLDRALVVKKLVDLETDLTVCRKLFEDCGPPCVDY